jgi:hypothetical protein
MNQQNERHLEKQETQIKEERKTTVNDQKKMPLCSYLSFTAPFAPVPHISPTD